MKLTDAGANSNGSGINTNGASLVVIYKIVQPGYRISRHCERW